MRIINLCVDGLLSATDKGLFSWLAQQDADIICLQDIRMGEYDVIDNPAMQLEGMFCYVFDSPDGTYNGVAIYTRVQPKAIMTGFGFANGVDMDGRYVQADFEQISIGSLLAPSASSEASSLEQKIQFFDDLQAHLNKITRKRREYVFAGNWHMVHTENDLSNADEHRSSTGFLAHERLWLDQVFSELGYVDAFRRVNKDNDEYSWWPSGAINEGDGWRPDFQVASEDMGNKVEYASIYKTQLFSTHLPVIVDYDYELER